jgi:hypothetical protein
VADDPKDPSNNNSEEASPLGKALIFIGLGCIGLGWLIGQRECYVYFTCAEQETQFLGLLVIGIVLFAVGMNTSKQSS